MPRTYRDLNMSPFADPDQRRLFDEISRLLGQCNVDDARCWTCFAWNVTFKASLQRRGRTYLGRDELVLMLHDAVQWLRAHGYWWPMITVVVKSPPKTARRRSGCRS